MKCNEVRQHWNLYHDSEGDAEVHFQIGEHLAMCPDCAERFHRQSRLEGLIAERLSPQRPTPELWDRVLVGARVSPAVTRRRWVWWAGAAASAAAVAITLGIWGLPRADGEADLPGLSAAWHERLVRGEEIIPFQSRSDLEVENYLRQRVSFAVRCPPRKDAGFAVHGAGVCTLAEQPTAYLSGMVDEAPVSIFILPRTSLTAFPHQREAIAKSKTHRCQEGQYAMVLGAIDQNVVMVIGKTEPERLEKVLTAYGTYPEHH